MAELKERPRRTARKARQGLPAGKYLVVLVSDSGDHRTVYEAQRGEEALKFMHEFLYCPKGHTIGIVPPG